MYKHLCSWLLYGYVYDPYHEFYIQPSSGESHDTTSQSQEEEDDDLGIMGVTGRQLQVCKLNEQRCEKTWGFRVLDKV